MDNTTGEVEQLRKLVTDIRDYYVSCGIGTPEGPFTIQKSIVKYLLRSLYQAAPDKVLQDLEGSNHILALSLETVTFSAAFFNDPAPAAQMS